MHWGHYFGGEFLRSECPSFDSPWSQGDVVELYYGLCLCSQPWQPCRTVTSELFFCGTPAAWLGPWLLSLLSRSVITSPGYQLCRMFPKPMFKFLLSYTKNPLIITCPWLLDTSGMPCLQQVCGLGGLLEGRIDWGQSEHSFCSFTLE